MARAKKGRLGAKGSGSLDKFHPSEPIRTRFGSDLKRRRLSKCTIVGRSRGRASRRGKETDLYHITHDDFPGKNSRFPVTVSELMSTVLMQMMSLKTSVLQLPQMELVTLKMRLLQQGMCLDVISSLIKFKSLSFFLFLFQNMIPQRRNMSQS